jgi:hypothetical protein
VFILHLFIQPLRGCEFPLPVNHRVSPGAIHFQALRA